MTKILIILPESIGGRLTTSSIIDGFDAIGIETSVVDILKDTDSTIEKIIKNETFDFLMSYDFTAIKFKKQRGFDIPTINYFSDVIEDPHSGSDWKEYYRELSNPLNYVFYWDKTLTEEKQKDDEIKNLFCLPHFVNTNIYKNTDLKNECDVMFAGRLDTDYRLNSFIDIMKSFPQYNFAWYAIQKHFDDAISRTDEDGKKLLKSAYKGFIDNEPDMAKALNKTKIVINFNQQGKSSLNYRTIQTLACERILISDYRKEGVEYFGHDYICYGSIHDLKNKIHFYLENPKSTIESVKRIRKIIERDFSHIAGADKIVKIVTPDLVRGRTDSAIPDQAGNDNIYEAR